MTLPKPTQVPHRPLGLLGPAATRRESEARAVEWAASRDLEAAPGTAALAASVVAKAGEALAREVVEVKAEAGEVAAVVTVAMAEAAVDAAAGRRVVALAVDASAVLPEAWAVEGMIPPGWARTSPLSYRLALPSAFGPARGSQVRCHHQTR